MRLFVCYDQSGAITSAIKVNVMADSLDNPFGEIEDNEAVIEVESTSELEALESHEIAEQYSVDLSSKKIKRRE